MEGAEHTVQLKASTLYEAVALGLASIRSDEWVEEIPERLNSVKASVLNIPVEHSVKITDFNAWLLKGRRQPGGNFGPVPHQGNTGDGRDQIECASLPVGLFLLQSPV